MRGHFSSIAATARRFNCYDHRCNQEDCATRGITSTERNDAECLIYNASEILSLTFVHTYQRVVRWRCTHLF